MKLFLGIFLLFFSALPAIPQHKITRAEAIQHYCRAAEVINGPEFERMASVRSSLAPVLARVPNQRIDLAVVDSNVINAWENNLNAHLALICVAVPDIACCV